jgi:hypothetical protein
VIVDRAAKLISPRKLANFLAWKPSGFKALSPKENS